MCRTEFSSVAYDLIIVWDVLTIVGAGLAANLLSPALPLSEARSAIFGNEALRVTLLGPLLAPLVLHDDWARNAGAAFALRGLVARTVQRVMVLVLAILGTGWLTGTLGNAPALAVAVWLLSLFPAAVAGRLLFWWVISALTRRRLLCDRVAVLGAGPVAERILAVLAAGRQRGVDVVAAFCDGLDGNGAGLDDALAQLVAMGRRRQLDRVVLAMPQATDSRLLEIAHRLKALDVEVAACSPLLARIGTRIAITDIAGVPLFVVTGRPRYRWSAILKQILDQVLAALLAVAAAPLLVLLALAVRLDSPGPVIFRQRRHGCNGSEFDVFKFRTMQWCGAAGSDGAVQTRRGARRLTRVGAFLRHTSLDELPQLFNVLNGTMSLVGPRPHPVVMRTEQRLGEEIVAEYAHRHRVKPGITGWAQINGCRGATETAEQVRKRIEYDLHYIENWSLLFDLRILVLTPFKIIFQRGAAF